MKALANTIGILGATIVRMITPDPERVKNLTPGDYFKSGFMLGVFVEAIVFLLFFIYASR